MVDNKTKILEREYTIPLREKCRPVPRYKKTPKAVKTVKEFIARHMRVEDRDLNKVKIDKFLNEALWHRGIKNPINKIKVKAVKEESGIVRVYGVALPTGIEFKKLREEKKSAEQEKIGKEAAKVIAERKKAEEEAMQAEEDKDADGVNDKAEEKEKKEALEESNEKELKAEAKKEKHTAEVKTPKQTKNLEKDHNKSSRGQ